MRIKNEDRIKYVNVVYSLLKARGNPAESEEGTERGRRNRLLRFDGHLHRRAA